MTIKILAPDGETSTSKYVPRLSYPEDVLMVRPHITPANGRPSEMIGPSKRKVTPVMKWVIPGFTEGRVTG